MQHIFVVQARHVLDTGHVAQTAVVVDDHTSFGPERDAHAGSENNNDIVLGIMHCENMLIVRYDCVFYELGIAFSIVALNIFANGFC